MLARMIGEIGEVADLFLVGAGESGEQFAGRADTTVIWEYQKLELGDYLRDIDADLGLMLSVVPETFSYTLSELWAAGVPVLATNLGAFSDRIVEGHNGWLVEPLADPILAKIRGDRTGQRRASRYESPIERAACAALRRNGCGTMRTWQLLPGRFHLPGITYPDVHTRTNTPRLSRSRRFSSMSR